jgi:hypothetical protein
VIARPSTPEILAIAGSLSGEIRDPRIVAELGAVVAELARRSRRPSAA